VILLSCLSLFAPAAVAETSPDPLRILYVGNSITQGKIKARDEFTYRLPLQQLLHEARIAYQFIGSQRTGLDGGTAWPDVAEGVPFDPRHEGYYGNKTAQVVEKVIDAWVPDHPAPDFVLVHLGTNDQENRPHEATVVAPLDRFITYTRAQNPEVVILLGHLNFNDSDGANTIRPLVEQLATSRTTSASPVETVNHYRGWHENPDHPDTDTFDWAHPNPKGQRKMAANWWATMLPDCSQR